MKKVIKKILWMLAVTGVISCVGMSHPKSVSAAVVSDSNSDNTTATANNMTVGDTVSGAITETDDLDFYKFTLDSAGCVALNMTSYMQYYCIIVYDSDGEEVWYTGGNWWNSGNEWNSDVGFRKDTYDLHLEKGTYYMQINGYRYGNEDKSTGRYEMNTAFISSDTSFNGDDNSFAAANSILWETNYTGQISLNDDFDTYIFRVASSKTVVVNITSYMKYYCIKIFNEIGEEIWYTGGNWWNSGNEWNSDVGFRKDIHNIVLSAGTYYMQINGYRYGSDDKSTGKYTFRIEELNQKNCTHKYTDKTVYPTYFAQGYDFHKCEKCGYSYKDKYTEKKKLGQSYFYSDCYAAKAKLYLSWSVVSDASGYQIRYSLNKKFKSGVITKTIKGQVKNKKTISKLKRKKNYYVQVRAYKKSGMKTVYGKWSTKGVLKTN